MTAQAGERIRTLLDVLASDGRIVPIGTSGHVVGFSGEKLVVAFEDRDTGEKTTAELNPWEVLRVRMEVAR